MRRAPLNDGVANCLTSPTLDYAITTSRSWKGVGHDIPIVQLITPSSNAVLLPSNFTKMARARICAVIGLIDPTKSDHVAVAASSWADDNVPVILALAQHKATTWSRGDMIDLVHSFSISSRDNSENPGSYRFVNIITRPYPNVDEAMKDPSVCDLVKAAATLHQITRMYSMIN